MLEKLMKWLGIAPSYSFAGIGEWAFEEDEGLGSLDSKQDSLMFKKGGGEAVVEKPVYTPPPAAPAPVEAATQEEAVTPEVELSRKKEALKKGAKSLQIPTTEAAGTQQVGTGQ